MKTRTSKQSPVRALAGIVVIPLLVIVIPPRHATAQPTGTQKESAETETPADQNVEAIKTPDKVDVQPVAADDEIADRLEGILNATGWFDGAEIRVDEGVVFLKARTAKQEYKDWAANLAGNTQDVVAVVNHISVIESPWWNLAPAWNELRSMGRDAIQAAPLILVALLFLIITWNVAKFSVRASTLLFERRMNNRLLRQVAGKAIAIPVFLLGLYLVLRIAGLTQIAATVVGGTGLIGLVIGIAFQDIAENFLASLLISTQRPFAIGDLIEVEGNQGYVQSVTTRGTLLMTLDGNHVQIPNATIYKATIRNFSANPKIRQDFLVGIGYDDSLTDAQETALQVLQKHPAVLDDPEPSVLVDELGAATVNLRIYFWIDGHAYSTLKVRSSLIRQVKGAFEKAGISMPDESREVIFPNDVPVLMVGDDKTSERQHRVKQQTSGQPSSPPRTPAPDEAVVTAAEGGLGSEKTELQEQARQSRIPEGANLLDSNGESNPQSNQPRVESDNPVIQDAS